MENTTNSFTEEMLRLQAEMKAEQEWQEEIDEEVDQAPEKTEEVKQKSVLDLILAEGKVTQDQIDQWKALYGGKVYATYFDENDNYIYRYITRTEYKEVVRNLTSAKEPTPDMEHEMVVSKCILFPKLDAAARATIAGGTLETLYKQILFASNFVPEAMAIQMISKL